MSHLQGKSLKELRQLCQTKGLTCKKLRKDELIALLVEQETNIETNEPEHLILDEL
jgi:hypothetical protein